MIILNQSIAQARAWLAANPPARVERVERERDGTERTYTTVAPREWIRQGGAALSLFNLVLRARGGEVVMAPGGPVLRQSYRLTHLYSADADEWTRDQALDTRDPLAKAQAGAETCGLAGAIKSLLWDTAPGVSADDVPDPSERPRAKPVEDSRTQAQIQEHARLASARNGTAPTYDRNERPLHPIGPPTPIVDKKDGGDWITTGENPGRFGPHRGKPHTVPPDASMEEHLGLAPGDGLPASSAPTREQATADYARMFDALAARGFERINQPAKPAPSQAGEAGTAEPARPAVDHSLLPFGAGHVDDPHLLAVLADPDPVGAKHSDDGGSVPPAAPSSTPPADEVEPPSSAGGGSSAPARECRTVEVEFEGLVCQVCIDSDKPLPGDEDEPAGTSHEDLEGDAGDVDAMEAIEAQERVEHPNADDACAGCGELARDAAKGDGSCGTCGSNDWVPRGSPLYTPAWKDEPALEGRDPRRDPIGGDVVSGGHGEPGRMEVLKVYPSGIGAGAGHHVTIRFEDGETIEQALVKWRTRFGGHGGRAPHLGRVIAVAPGRGPIPEAPADDWGETPVRAPLGRPVTSKPKATPIPPPAAVEDEPTRRRARAVAWALRPFTKAAKASRKDPTAPRPTCAECERPVAIGEAFWRGLDPEGFPAGQRCKGPVPIGLCHATCRERLASGVDPKAEEARAPGETSSAKARR